MPFEDEPGSLDRLRAIGAEGEVASVVEQEVGAAAAALVASDAAFKTGGDAGGGDVGTPVEAHGIPKHGGETQVAGGAKNIRAASAMRRAKKVDWRAKDVLECGIAAGELFADSARALDCEPGMGDGVVADEVARSVDLADEVRSPADMATNEEEGRAQAMPGEEIEQAAGPGVVGSVIVRQRKLGTVAAGDKSAAEELRLRIHGRVGAASGGEAGSGARGGKSEEHVKSV
jgi:hypothetical protein